MTGGHYVRDLLTVIHHNNETHTGGAPSSIPTLLSGRQEPSGLSGELGKGSQLLDRSKEVF